MEGALWIDESSWIHGNRGWAACSINHLGTCVVNDYNVLLLMPNQLVVVLIIFRVSSPIHHHARQIDIFWYFFSLFCFASDWSLPALVTLDASIQDHVRSQVWQRLAVKFGLLNWIIATISMTQIDKLMTLAKIWGWILLKIKVDQIVVNFFLHPTHKPWLWIWGNKGSIWERALSEVRLLVRKIMSTFYPDALISLYTSLYY